MIDSKRKCVARGGIIGAAAIGIVIGDPGPAISPSTVTRLIKSGLLRASKLPGRTSAHRVDLEEIDRFNQAMRTGQFNKHFSEAAE